MLTLFYCSYVDFHQEPSNQTSKSLDFKYCKPLFSLQKSKRNGHVPRSQRLLDAAAFDATRQEDAEKKNILRVFQGQMIEGIEDDIINICIIGDFHLRHSWKKV